jgi:hypothetical protein
MHNPKNSTYFYSQFSKRNKKNHHREENALQFSQFQKAQNSTPKRQISQFQNSQNS